MSTKNTNSDPIKYRTVPRGGGGVFKIANNAGMIEWGQKSKPRKIPRASNKTPKKFLDEKLTPKKSLAEFLSLKNFQEALINDITRCTLRQHPTANLQIVLNTQKILT